MKNILNLSNYTAKQIADSINSIWVGEYGNLNRNDFVCGIADILNYTLEEEPIKSLLISSAVIDIYCGNRQKAEIVRNLMNEKGFRSIDLDKTHIRHTDDNYVVFIGKYSSVKCI